MVDRKKNQAGFSLTELIVATSLTFIVLLAVGSCLTTFMRINNKVVVKNDYDRKAQLALTMITEELRYLQFDSVSVNGKSRDINGRIYRSELVYKVGENERKIVVDKNILIIEKENNQSWHSEGIQDVWFIKDDQKKMIEVQIRPIMKRGEETPTFKTIIKPLNQSTIEKGEDES